MTRYILDTNVYIRATRDEEWNRELTAFYSAFTPALHLHSVVAAELIAGAIRPGLEEETRERFVSPFEAVGRIVTPSHGAWLRAGGIVSALVRENRVSPNGIKRSFFNDCLIAASARDHGFTLVTADAGDFEVIAAVEPLRFEAPWPTPGSTV